MTPHRQLVPSALAVLAFAACSATESYRSLHVRTENAVVWMPPEQEVHYVAYYDGETILGAQAVTRPDFPLAEIDVDGRPAVDHPQLEVWQAQCARMLDLAADPRTTPDDLVAATRGFPFTEPCEDALTRWIDGQAQRAALMLDRRADLRARRLAVEQWTRLALRAELDDTRLAGWIHALLAADDDDAMLAVLQNERAGPECGQAVLRDLGDVRSARRREAFELAAHRVIGRPGGERLVVEAVDSLRYRDEAGALIATLENHDSPDLARAALESIEARPHDERIRVFEAALVQVAPDARVSHLLVQALEELPFGERAAGFRLVLDSPLSRDLATLTRLIEVAETMRNAEHGAFLLEVLERDGAAHPQVQRAIELSANDLTKTRRRMVLERLDAVRAR